MAITVSARNVTVINVITAAATAVKDSVISVTTDTNTNAVATILPPFC
jgi:hypothetical protein